MADFQTLDLGRIMQTAAALKQAQAQTQTDALRNKVLGIQAQQAQTGLDQQQGVDALLASNPNPSLTDFQKYGRTGVEASTNLSAAQMQDLTTHYKQGYITSGLIASADDPVTAVKQYAPQFPQQYDQVHGQGAFSKLTPEQIKQGATQQQQQYLQGIVDPNKVYEAQQQMIQDHYKQEGPGGEAARAAATNAITQRGQNMTATTADKNRAAENLRAGISPDGSVDPNIKKIAQQIADYRLPPPTGMSSRSPRAMQVMAAVSDIDPNYDATQYGAKNAALKSLTSGKDGQTLDSVNTAVQHLSQLKGLLAALGSGDIQLINQARQAYQTATGNPAPTNAAVVANMAAGEVNKVVTGSPGAEGDRDLSRSAIQLKGSPEQQTQAMDNIIGLMAGRLKGTQNRFEQAKLGPVFDRMLLPETKVALAAHGSAATPPAATPTAVPTATGPNGQKLILQNGAWVPVKASAGG